jgi:hypothetical protein
MIPLASASAFAGASSGLRSAVGYYRYDTQLQLRLLNQLCAQLRLLRKRSPAN